MNHVETALVALADGIRAGKLEVAGKFDLVDIGQTTICTTTLEAVGKRPDWLRLSLELEVIRKTKDAPL